MECGLCREFLIFNVLLAGYWAVEISSWLKLGWILYSRLDYDGSRCFHGSHNAGT
ncbi:uncharacterized protein BDV14DRAFT_173462 [Aspergillus stella-maris]|uniref:uncharacterized protein n=1 Tax=Aspergillus stella-maris TaxID=1810926 RepID=UPI003CCE4048